MAEARVRIILDDEEGGGNTWVTTVPVGRSYPRSYGVVRAVGEAAALFITSIVNDREVVSEKLAELERRSV